MESKDTEGCVTKTGTFDLVIEELMGLEQSSPDGFTVEEMSGAVGHGPGWCRTKLGVLIKSGKAACVGRRSATCINGRVGVYTPVYRLL